MSAHSPQSEHRILLTAKDPRGVARATDALVGTPLPWVAPEEPAASEATVWFCAGTPPVSPLSLPRLRSLDAKA